MSLLGTVGPVGQQVAEAIATVLKMEVEIIDQRLMRIAGTGRVKGEIGWRLLRGLVNKHVLAEGDYVVIDAPGDHAICQNCSLVGECFYQGYIVYPIQFGGKIIGTISLVAFSQTQKELLLSDLPSHITFLGRMGELLASKIKEKEMFTQKVMIANQLQAVLDSVYEGVLALDANGTITHFNTSAEKMCGVKRDLVLGQHISRLFSDQLLQRELAKGSGFSFREVFGEIQGRKFHFVMTVKPIMTDKQVPVGLVASFHDYSETEKLAFEMLHRQDDFTFAQIIGTSNVIRDVKQKAAKIAASNSTVLILGESGTGKEVFARAIHAASPNAAKMFVAINCGAIPETLLESELFGYEEGAFTGARQGGKLGKIELANGGTVFLDEIGNMSLYLQAKLLRVLEERQIERVGGTHSFPVNIRVIAAANQDLPALVAMGSFREDLYYRLNVIPLVIPPLRERKEDIPLLLEHYLKRYSQLLNKEIIGFTKEALRLCQRYDWPGNVRELINGVEYAINLEDGHLIGVDSLPPKLREDVVKKEGIRGGWSLSRQIPTLEELEREVILQALNQWGWSEHGKRRTATALGLSRATIYRRIKKYNLDEFRPDCN